MKDFSIWYMINLTLNHTKAFREQWNKYMKTKFFAITQSRIKTILAKKKTRVLALLMFYEARKNHKKYFKVLSCVIYTIISKNVCIEYLYCESKSKVKYRLLLEGFQTRNKNYDKILGIENPDF